MYWKKIRWKSVQKYSQNSECGGNLEGRALIDLLPPPLFDTVAWSKIAKNHPQKHGNFGKSIFFPKFMIFFPPVF